MRLPARPVATSALCAALLLGVTGPAATAADGESARERARTASRAPLPDADELNARIQALSGLGGVVTPVAELLGAVLEADDGRLTARQADRLGDAVDAAIDAAVDDALAEAEAAGAPAGAGTAAPDVAVPWVEAPARPPAVLRPNGDAPVTTLPAPVAPARTDSGGPAGAALDALRQAVDALLGVSTTGRADQVGPAVAGVVNGVADVATVTLSGGGLPAPDPAALPPLPASPSGSSTARALPDTPANPS
ncbi:hypothetical protein SUDANB6_03885 [Streptomyces sp. enrichment culture]|uniref:hypothetical protein n=1 Tax=Streptomyces sp. enrichment culture TaxID=1795815 RepID=UPI003F572F01